MTTAALARVAAIVVSYNTAAMLERCLDTLGESAAIEVVVVDNASQDGSAAVARARPRVRLREAGANLGFGRAVNLGLAETGRDFILTLNPDCLARPEAIAILAERMAADPALGFAGPRIVMESGREDHASLRGDPDPLGAFLYLSRISRLFPRSAWANSYSRRHLDYTEEQELAAGTAGCLLFRREALEQVGGFDPDYFMYGEDLDVCRRIREAGYTGRYIPSAQVLHIKGEATRQQSGRMLREFHRSMWTYYRKHEAPKRPAVVNGLVRAGIVALAGARLAVNSIRREKRVSAR